VPAAAQIALPARDSSIAGLRSQLRRPWHVERVESGPASSAALDCRPWNVERGPGISGKNRHVEAWRPKIRPLGSPLTVDRRLE